MATIDSLTPCQNYSLEVGAGPYLYREHQGLPSSLASYSDKDKEDLLTSTINKVWASQEDAFKSFASTAPVSQTVTFKMNLIHSWQAQ